MGKERSIEIVNSVGATVLTLDGDAPGGIRSVNGSIFHDERDIVWPLLAGSLNSYMWSARVGVWSVVGVTSIISVSGSSAATAQVRVCSGLTAIGSGVAQLSAVLDLQETAPNKQTGAMIATPTLIFPGDSVAIDFGGTTLTALVGCLTVAMKRVS